MHRTRTGKKINLNTQVETEEDVWDYPAPAGVHDFHRIADRLATEHPRDMATGRWLIALRGAGEDQYYRFSWRASG